MYYFSLKWIKFIIHYLYNKQLCLILILIKNKKNNNDNNKCINNSNYNKINN